MLVNKIVKFNVQDFSRLIKIISLEMKAKV